MTNSTAKPQGALGTLACIYALMIMLPMFLAAQCAISALRLAGDGLIELADIIEKAGRWALPKLPRLDRHERIGPR